MVYYSLVMPRKALSLTAVLAAAVYAVLWIGVAARWSWLTAADTWTLDRFRGYGLDHPAWISVWGMASDLFSPGSLRIVGIVVIVIALFRGKLRIAAFLAVTVLAAGLVTVVAKRLSDRPRPETALTHVASSSFPSGHALGITVGVLALGLLLWPRLRASLRVPVVVAGGALILVVGVSRVVLNVHHPSDVVAGWALGLLHFLLCAAVVQPRVSEVSAV